MQATNFYLFNRSFCHQKIKLKNSFNRAMPRMTKMQISTFEAKNLADKKLGLLLHFQKMMYLYSAFALQEQCQLNLVRLF